MINTELYMHGVFFPSDCVCRSTWLFLYSNVILNQRDEGFGVDPSVRLLILDTWIGSLGSPCPSLSSWLSSSHSLGFPMRLTGHLHCHWGWLLDQGWVSQHPTASGLGESSPRWIVRSLAACSYSYLTTVLVSIPSRVQGEGLPTSSEVVKESSCFEADLRRVFFYLNWRCVRWFTCLRGSKLYQVGPSKLSWVGFSRALATLCTTRYIDLRGVAVTTLKFD